MRILFSYPIKRNLVNAPRYFRLDYLPIQKYEYVAAGETLLKFTDYPFAYSIIAMIMGSIGVSLSQDHFIFLGIAGAFGTLLAVVDPVGALIRNREASYLKKKNKDIVDLTFKLSALKTKAITFEIEKILGLFYFIFLILAFAIVVTIPSPFFDKLIQKDILEILQVNELQLKSIFVAVSAIVIGILALRTKKFWNELDNEIDIAAYHLIAINDDNATQTSLQNMTRAIEQNDWTLAELWSEKIAEEIQYKKGKRELIIKAADMVFSKLHGETVEFENVLETMKWSKMYRDFPNKEWQQIKKHSQQSIVEDTELRHRIEKFYSLMNDYNCSIGNVSRTIHSIIHKRLSEVYKNEIDDIDFEMINGKIDILACAVSSTHPLNFDPQNKTLKTIRLRIVKGKTREYAEIHDTKLFDESWKLIIGDIENNNLIKKIKEDLNALTIENSKLQGIYSDKIEMQWKV